MSPPPLYLAPTTRDANLWGCRSGNKPPWTLPVKAKYGVYEFVRNKRAAGLADITPPTDLMAVSRSMLPLRALHYIKVHADPEAYLATWRYMFHLFWSPEKRVFNQPDELAAVLGEIPRGYAGPGSSQSGPRLFGPHEVERIVRATGKEEWKNALKATVDEALERGAFGAPWFWATNAKGESEPFFGSDR
jgi:glutathione S-transferase kappa 1